MAKSNLNVVMQGASGKIGKTLVFRQQHDGETIIANRPKKSSLTPHPTITATRNKFQNATYRAVRLLKDPMYGPMYDAKKKPGKSAYLTAMTDCLTPPQIKKILLENYAGQIGDLITIYAIDDFMVTAVKVRILSLDEVIEEGSAQLDVHGLDWVYTASALNNSMSNTIIEVTAYDIPGNRTVETVNIL